MTQQQTLNTLRYNNTDTATNTEHSVVQQYRHSNKHWTLCGTTIPTQQQTLNTLRYNNTDSNKHWTLCETILTRKQTLNTIHSVVQEHYTLCGKTIPTQQQSLRHWTLCTLSWYNNTDTATNKVLHWTLCTLWYNNIDIATNKVWHSTLCTLWPTTILTQQHAKSGTEQDGRAIKITLSHSFHSEHLSPFKVFCDELLAPAKSETQALVYWSDSSS